MSDSEVDAAMPWDAIIEALEQIAVDDAAVAPARTVHTVPDANGHDAAFLLKPGWVTADIIGVKAVTFFPNNGQIDMPTIQAGFMLFDAKNGSLIGACEANALTTRRTAAASAVAAKRLARTDARRLLVVGSGALAPMAVQAHVAVRNYETIEVWGRDPSKASRVVTDVAQEGIAASVSTDLDASVARADVISCVTGSRAPLVKGRLLKAGAHLDLIGSFTPEMRESDDDAVTRATLFADTEDALLAGDLAQPIAAGVITADDVVADFADLVAGRHPGRTSNDEITFFKSAGFALEDLAAARLVFS